MNHIIKWDEPSTTFNNFFNSNIDNNPYIILTVDYKAVLVHNYIDKTTMIVFETIDDYVRFMLEWS